MRTLWELRKLLDEPVDEKAKAEQNALIKEVLNNEKAESEENTETGKIIKRIRDRIRAGIADDVVIPNCPVEHVAPSLDLDNVKEKNADILDNTDAIRENTAAVRENITAIKANRGTHNCKTQNGHREFIGNT